MNIHAPKPNKYKAYRERKKALGRKQIRIWTIDPDAPGMRDRLKADFDRLRNLSSEREAMDFLEALQADLMPTIPH